MGNVDFHLRCRLAAALVLATVCGSSAPRAATLAPGFYESLVADGLTNPTAMAFAPDGRLFVCEQAGTLRVIKDGRLLAKEFAQLTVSPSGSAGLLGVAFDPDFATTQFVYVYYTTTGTPHHNRISRLTASGDEAIPGSEVLIFDLDEESHSGHNGGAIHFGVDGKLYAAVGDNHDGTDAQSFENLFGKILRINRNGTIPSDNPFYFSAAGKNRAIWALGLRNPFTFAVQPGTGSIFINDVGEDTWEEINRGVAGANFGWPDTEGPTSDPRFQSPVYSYGHGETATTGCSIAGGAFYNPATVQFPAEYVGQYFFADFCTGWIRRLDPSTPDVTAGFATGISRPVDLKVGPDGGLYYLSRDEGAVYRILAAPAGTFVLSVQTDGSGDGTVTSDPGNISCPRTCSDAIAGGTVVALTASPGPEATFAGWSGACSGSGSCVVTLDAAKSVTATFIDGRDLVIDGITNPPPIAAAGTTFGVTDTTTNVGFAAAGASTTRFYLSVDAIKGTADTLLTAVRSVPELDAGLSSTGATTVTIPASIASGPYLLLACADDRTAVPEADETNNCRASSTSMIVGRPDLVEVLVSNPPAEAAPGSAFGVSDTVRNQGAVTAAASTTRYYLSLDAARNAGDIRLTGTTSVPTLTPGTSANGSRSVTVPSATALGVYYLLACADDLSKLAEESETNNCIASATRVAIAWPDLVTTGVTNPPTEITPGGKFTVTDTVANAGSTTAAATTSRYYLSLNAAKDAGDALLSGSRAVVSLAPGVTSTGSKGVTVPATLALGTYYLLACADDTAKVSEASETNNCLASTGAVNVTMADLVTTAVTNPPASAAPGGSFTITDTVLNQGSGSAGKSTTRYYLSLDASKDAGDALLSGSRLLATLASGAASTGSKVVTIPTSVPAGTYRLLACADDSKTVAELVETNNCRASATAILIQP
jgi:glucose/arabinose dehydrogenase/subtilase family serine protease